MNRYVSPNKGTAGYDGVNGDFLNLECDEGQTRMRTACTATASLRTNNDFSDYQIDRKSISVQARLYDDGELGTWG